MTWMKNFLPPVVVCRPALSMDTDDALKLSRLIWEGEDYVPLVWADWLSDPDGLLVVAEYGGVVVGFGKLTKLSAKEWWLEGLRVHPEFEGRGIASRVNNHQYEFWLRNGCGTLRLATSSNRLPVKHIARKLGFQGVGEFTTFEAPVIEAEGTSGKENVFKLVKLSDIELAMELIWDPARGWTPNSLLDIGWKWVSPHRSYLEDYVRNQQAWWWRDKKGILIQVDKREEDEIWARIRMLTCSSEDLNDCLSETRIFAGQRGYSRLTWLARLIPGCEAIFEKSGFSRTWDGSLLVFEKEHPQD